MLAPVDGRRSAAMAAAATRGAASASRGLALLLLGHRTRLMFDTVPDRVIAPLVADGTPVDFFALLENSTMARAFRGRRPLGTPAFAALSDEELKQHLASAVHGAGGNVATLRIGPRPLVTLPDFPRRLSRYTEAVKMTVAARFAKEGLGWRIVEAYEQTRGAKYAWVLWTREDSHWFAALELRRFSRGAVHGKSCGGFGGWNDKVWLMDREWAPAMLGMYKFFHTAYPASCIVLGAASAPAAALAATSPSDATSVTTTDFLAAPSVEQFRERVGKLHRVPYSKHPPELLPTMDSYYTREGGGADAARGTAADAGWRLCFPKIYATGCVPRLNQSAVNSMSCA